MQKLSLQKTRLLKSILQTLGSLRDWFTRSSKERLMSLSLLIYQKIGMYIEDSILDQPIQQSVSGLQLIETEIGLYQQNITLRGKRLIITLESSTPIRSQKELWQLMVIHLGHSVLVNLVKGEYTLPRPIKKRGQTSTPGSDLVSKRWLRSLKPHQAIRLCWTHFNNPTLMYRTHQGECHLCSYLANVSIPYVSSKPTAGKKRVLP